MRLRVVYITMGFPLAVETFACTDLRALMDGGTDVEVYSLRFAPAHGRALLAERGLAGVRVDYSTWAGALRGLMTALKHPRRLLQTLAWLLAGTWRQPRFFMTSLLLLPRCFEVASAVSSRPSGIVHLFWGHYPAMVAYLLRRQAPECIISMFLGAYDLEYHYGPSAPAAREADVVWTHARENVSEIEKLGVARERIEVAHRGVDLGSFRPAIYSKIAGRIVCAARLCREKHIDDVLQVFARLLGRWPELSLVVMGDGPERQRLVHLSRDLGIDQAVRFLGHVAHDVVRDEMAAAEFFILMSRETTERLTNATKEAMASACLCAVTRSPGIGELLIDGIEGFIVEHADIEGVVSRITWALQHPAESSKMRTAAAERIQHSFDVARGMDAYRRRWLELASGHDGPTVLHTPGRPSPAAVPLAERS